MTAELFANTPSTTVSSGGTDAPASGTPETWTVASSTGFPAAVTDVSQFHVGDPAATSEMIAVTSVSGDTWSVVRGAESTTPVAHTAGFTVQQVTTAGVLGSFAQTGFGDLGGSGDDPEVVSTHLSAALPTTQGGTGEDAASASALLTALGALQAADNLSDVSSKTASLANLGGLPLAGGTMSGPIAMASNKVTGLENGSSAQDAAAFGQIPSSLPPSGTAGGVLTGTYPNPGITTLNQNTTGTAASVSGTVAIVNGGTGQGTQQGAIDSLAGAVTAGTYLRGSGTHVSMAVIQAADVPTLNQNTTGTASNITDTLDQVPAPAANVSLNSHKITSLVNGASAQDAAAFGQIPTSLPPNGSAGGDLGSTYPNPTVTATHLASALTVSQGGTGQESLTAYVLLAGGTASTAAVQSLASTGSGGNLVTSAGAGALPVLAAPIDLAMEPTGTLARTVPVHSINNANITAWATGGTVAVNIIALPAGMTVTSIQVLFGSTGATGPTHFWVALCDLNLNVLAVSTDRGSGTQTASQPLKLGVTIDGTHPYAVVTTTYYYIAASSSASSAAPTAGGLGGTTGASNLTPTPYGTAGTQAGAPTVGAQLNSGTVTANANMNFAAWIS